MTRTMIFKAPISFALTGLLLAGGMTGCKAPQSEASKPALTSETQRQLPPLRKALQCLPRKAAMIAAHRGTDERRRERAENSIGALNALIDHGILIAEIDVAGLRDGTLITFHDGVWDDISTGSGPISRSTKSDLDNILLRSRKGGLTADRPPEFKDMLRAAKDKIYLEVDFNSSANPREVIKQIQTAGMEDHVLLIAYNAKQAKEFARLAPNMLRSNPADATRKDHAVWMGYGVANGGGTKAANYSEQGIFTIGRLGDPNRQPAFSKLRTAADILVTDQAERYDGIEGMSRKERAEYEGCLGLVDDKR